MNQNELFDNVSYLYALFIQRFKMPQSIFVQVGQCGNQIGYRFWELAYQEYLLHQHFEKSADNFFKISHLSKKSCTDLSKSLKARALLIDMEEGVVSRILHGPLKYIFDRKQLITDVSGSGNNWAVGNKFYGSKYRSELKNLFRKEAEDCDNLQSFLLLHSISGGTGSGLGTAIIEHLYDDFPKIPKFSLAVFPSLQNDVVTSPYNALLANRQLINFADCVIPFDNGALTEICNKVNKTKSSKISSLSSNSKSKFSANYAKMHGVSKEIKPFEDVNDVIANTILNLTCLSRFPGSLNTDINDIVTNMTPYPRLHYLIPSVSPVLYFHELRQKLDETFNEVFSTSHQLLQCSLKEGVLLACALLCRGQISMSDVLYNLERLKKHRKFVPWNNDGWKIGLCDIPHINSHYSILMLSNSTSVAKSLCILRNNFLKMYNKKAHLHHFLDVECMEKEDFKLAVNDLTSLIKEYKSMEKINQEPSNPRLNILL